MKTSKLISLALFLLLFVPAGAQQPQDMENGYEYVDLGLSVNWATCNVGANKPEGYGGYYAWGETEEKETLGWTNYRFRTSGGENVYYNADVRINKYNWLDSCGVVDNKTILDLDDDVAPAIPSVQSAPKTTRFCKKHVKRRIDVVLPFYFQKKIKAYENELLCQ